MFRTVPLSTIRSFSLYTQQWYMSYRFADSLRAGSGRNVLILLASCHIACKLGLMLVKLIYVWPTSSFRCGVKENTTLLGIYAEWNASFLPTFRNKVNVP